jgi:CheY-like chemotaxis protein
MSNLEFDTFEQYVRDCLSHLYDFEFLQDHPLLTLLVPDATGKASRVQVFRQHIGEVIEQLKLPAGSEFQSRNARLYNILSLRYLRQQPILYILHQLNLSERQFYRDHTKAVRTVSTLLWEQVRTPAPVSHDPASATSAISIQSEIRHIQSQSTPHQVEAAPFLQKTVMALQSLVEQYKATIDLQISERWMSVGTDQIVLRQALIYILSQLIIQFPAGSRFSLAFDIRELEYEFQFTCEYEHRSTTDQETAQAPIVALSNQETLHGLVEALGGRITVPAESNLTLILEVPVIPYSILMIDDNPDAITLFRNYLAHQPYQLLTAADGKQAMRMAREFRPELIVLDVMLPEQDGWEILQGLKKSPETRTIPVLICSVLDVSDLALSLGADGFLKKPPGEQDFLETLANFIA